MGNISFPFPFCFWHVHEPSYFLDAFKLLQTLYIYFIFQTKTAGVFVLLFPAVICKAWGLRTNGLWAAYLTHIGKSIHNIGKATVVDAARKTA